MRIKVGLTNREIEVLDTLLDRVTEPWSKHDETLELLGITRGERSVLINVYSKIRNVREALCEVEKAAG